MIKLKLTVQQRRRVWTHLLPKAHVVEEAAFLYAKVEQSGDEMSLRVVEVRLLGPGDFSYQSNCHIELADETRGQLIKEAHDLDAALVEVHSHLGPGRAYFSGSDLMGFDEWVPHVRWRLKGKPYAAIVVTRKEFDALVWHGESVERLTGLAIGRAKTETPSGLSPLAWRYLLEDRDA